LDGEQHAENAEYDQRRTEWLEMHGYCVLRFWNLEVFENLDGVLEAIWSAISGSGSPHPGPPHQGEGGEGGSGSSHRSPPHQGEGGEGGSGSSHRSPPHQGEGGEGYDR
jgi:hypothetical protein